MRKLVKYVVCILIRLLYRVEVKGLENIKNIRSSVIIANHTSLLDGLLLEFFVPVPKTFFIDTEIAKKPVIKFLIGFVKYYTINITNPFAIRNMLKTLKLGGNCVIFPEGRISVTGSLMKIQNGTGIIAEKGGYDILPVWIEGAVRSPFSYSRHKFVPRLFPKIIICIRPPIQLKVPPEIRGKKRREMLSLKIHDALRDAGFHAVMNRQDLFQNLCDAAKTFGYSRKILQDTTFVNLSYRKVLLGSLVLGKKIRQTLPDQKLVGFLLPNSNGAAVTFFALQAYGFTPCIINFSSGLESIRRCCIAADFNYVVTSRLFVEKGKLEPLIESLSELVTIIYLEDIRVTISLRDKIAGFMALINPKAARAKYTKKPDDPATVIFTSGSEGYPKGVVLSCKNIIANIAQINVHFSLTPSDINFNSLPIFHSFGLTVGTIYPMLKGLKVFMYPSPLHYATVPQLIYEIDATLMVGTDTFFAGYARKASDYDLQSIRLAVAGAEKVKETTQRKFFEKFGIRILEGYGVTEASPVIACNTPIHYKPGSVGRFLTGIGYKTVPIEGVAKGAELHINGPNIMLGYLKYDKPGVIQHVEEWYNTGDIVEVDQMDFISIVGRSKRFVKIAGEMVSLGSVENVAAEIDQDHAHAAVSINSERKGQEIILVTESNTLTRKDINQYVGENNESPLLIPRKVVFVEKIPLLGSGKTDYRAISELIEGSGESST